VHGQHQLKALKAGLEAFPEHLSALSAWRTGIHFLITRFLRPEFEERHYKNLCPLVESMMHWSWSVRGKALHDWNNLDEKASMDFIMRPPITWVTAPGCSRYSKKPRQNFADKPLIPPSVQSSGKLSRATIQA
jgi:hypothetical protein